MNRLSTAIFYAVYRSLLWPLLFLAFQFLGFFNSKIRQGLAMRKGQPWLKWKRAEKPIWIHCASGEFEYAKPVIHRLKSLSPKTKILVTYFSPSIAAAAAKYPWRRFRGSTSLGARKRSQNFYSISRTPCAADCTHGYLA